MDKSRYFSRTLEPALQRAAKEFPALVVTGPRQAGKTTLLRHLFGETHRYVSLEPPDVRTSAADDPRGFLAAFPPPVIFDEVQYAPELLPYIKEHIDEHRAEKGRFLLTGSQNLLLLERVTESLAGRAAIFQLFPLSLREIRGIPHQPLPWESGGEPPMTSTLTQNLWDIILRSGYPELHQEPHRDSTLWLGSYLQTYLERDIRSLRNIGDLSTFQLFLRGLAARTAQLLNLTEFSRDLGIAVSTVKSWLSMLEATHQIVLLRPYFANIGKRLVKTPKLYFTDTGLAAYLTGLRESEHAQNGPMGGVLFKNFAAVEVLKALSGRGETPRTWFWRTATGVEVDLLVEHDGVLEAIEMKLSQTPRPEMAKSLKLFMADVPELCQRGWVVHPGKVRLPLGSGCTALPLEQF